MFEIMRVSNKFEKRSDVLEIQSFGWILSAS